jgi:hypothetical protein
MLRRILTGLSILSLLVGAVVLIFWWRSYHHVDHFAIGSLGADRTEFTSSNGNVMVNRSQSIGGMIISQSTFYPIREVAAGCLIVPTLWLAILIRSKLPRPGRPPKK